MSREQVEQDYEAYKAQGRVWGQTPVERIATIRFARPDASIVARYLALTDLTTTVSDLLDTHGVRGAVAGSFMKPLLADKRIVGPAVTLRSMPERKTPTQAGLDQDPVKLSTRELYYLGEPGDVLVADFGANLEVSNLGGQSALVGKNSGFAGAIVNGAVRDVPAIRAIGFPVWSAGVTPITGKFRMEAMEINGPVRVHDVLVCAGDLVVADDSGVCIVPAGLIAPLIDEAERICAAEDKTRQLVARGAGLDELRPWFRERYR